MVGDRVVRIGAIEPGARLAPFCVAGFTDSHWLREAFGTVAYGFFPLRDDELELAARLIHSADERIPVDDLELGVELPPASSRWPSAANLGTWPTRRSASAGWLCRTACWCTGRPPGRVAVRTADGELRVASGREEPRGAGRDESVRFAARARLLDAFTAPAPRSGVPCRRRASRSSGPPCCAR